MLFLPGCLLEDSVSWTSCFLARPARSKQRERLNSKRASEARHGVSPNVGNRVFFLRRRLPGFDGRKGTQASPFPEALLSAPKRRTDRSVSHHPVWALSPVISVFLGDPPACPGTAALFSVGPGHGDAMSGIARAAISAVSVSDPGSCALCWIVYETVATTFQTTVGDQTPPRGRLNNTHHLFFCRTPSDIVIIPLDHAI